MPADFRAENVDLRTYRSSWVRCPSVPGGLRAALHAQRRAGSELFGLAGSQRVGGQRPRAGSAGRAVPRLRPPAFLHSPRGSRPCFPPSSTGPAKARAASGSAWNDLDLAEGAHSSLESAGLCTLHPSPGRGAPVPQPAVTGGPAPAEPGWKEAALRASLT